jgi:membrane protein YdbS with pleckstrin-like domain
MAKIMSNLLGPLDKSACLYFYLLSALFLFLFLILIIGFIVLIFRKRKQINSEMIASSLVLLFNAFLAYFVNRLLYSMCAKSLA